VGLRDLRTLVGERETSLREHQPHHLDVRFASLRTTCARVLTLDAGVASFFGYLFVGLLCAAVNTNEGLDNMLVGPPLTPCAQAAHVSVARPQVRLSKPPTPLVTRITAFLFSLGVIAPGIPVCWCGDAVPNDGLVVPYSVRARSVTTRYNLYVGKICSNRWSYFWGVYAPWLVSFVFFQVPIRAARVARDVCVTHQACCTGRFLCEPAQLELPGSTARRRAPSWIG
jgi:hypothetical protein